MPTPIIHGDQKPKCDKCNTATLRSLLHNDAKKQRLCTNCILRHNSAAFCPGCFAFYDGVPPHPSKRITCIKCKSVTHSHCAAAVTPPHAPYLCPLCKDPSSTCFNPNNLKFDKGQALILLCAARIAAALMRKAAEFARENAGMKAEEAARARKRAREALDQLVWVANEEKIRKLNEEERMRNVKEEEEEEEDEDFAKDLEILLIKEEMDVAAM